MRSWAITLEVYIIECETAMMVITRIWGHGQCFFSEKVIELDLSVREAHPKADISVVVQTIAEGNLGYNGTQGLVVTRRSSKLNCSL